MKLGIVLRAYFKNAWCTFKLSLEQTVLLNMKLSQIRAVLSFVV